MSCPLIWKTSQKWHNVSLALDALWPCTYVPRKKSKWGTYQTVFWKIKPPIDCIQNTKPVNRNRCSSKVSTLLVCLLGSVYGPQYALWFNPRHFFQKPKLHKILSVGDSMGPTEHMCEFVGSEHVFWDGCGVRPSSYLWNLMKSVNFRLTTARMSHPTFPFVLWFEPNCQSRYL